MGFPANFKNGGFLSSGESGRIIESRASFSGSGLEILIVWCHCISIVIVCGSMGNLGRRGKFDLSCDFRVMKSMNVSHRTRLQICRRVKNCFRHVQWKISFFRIWWYEKWFGGIFIKWMVRCFFLELFIQWKWNMYSISVLFMFYRLVYRVVWNFE